MPLPIPNLDDKTFKELVEEGRNLIPRYAPEWTEFNFSDPGITFIDLFAWLTEMQIYHLNRVTDNNYLKFLNLTGTAPEPAKPARADITFNPQCADTKAQIPQGTKIACTHKETGEDIIFETDADLTVLSIKLKKVLTKINSQWYDQTELNDRNGVYYFALGETVKSNNYLFLGFEADSHFQNEEIKLAINIYQDNDSSTSSDKGIVLTYTELKWEYWDGLKWQALNIIDNTHALTQSGLIIFTVPENIAQDFLANAEKVAPFTEDAYLYWLRASVLKNGYEIPPRIDTILLNTISATQAATIQNFTCQEFDGTGLLSQVIHLTLPANSEYYLKIEIKENNGQWQDWVQVMNFDSSCTCHRHYLFDSDNMKITFGNGIQGKIPPQGDDNIRVFIYNANLQQDLFASNGLPFQSFELNYKSVLPDTLRLEVYEIDSVWHEWNKVKDFDASGPDDRHYHLDLYNGIITFGDGIHGAIPPIPGNDEKNIIAVQYRVGGGEIGNIPAGQINKMLDATIQGVRVENRQPSRGGKNAESIADAQKRVRKDLKQATRAVTSSDFEKLVLAMPGAKIARVKVLPGYHPQFGGIKMPGTVTIVIVPQTLPDSIHESKPTVGLLKNVTRYLISKRLVTTNIRVIAPVFVHLDVAATVQIESRQSQEIMRLAVKDAIQEFLSPQTGGPEKNGWPFGRKVAKSELYQVIENVAGVTCTKYLSLKATGCYTEDEKGNIKIPEIGLVFPGKILITVI